MRIQSHISSHYRITRPFMNMNICTYKPHYEELGPEITTGTFYKCPVYNYVFVACQ